MYDGAVALRDTARMVVRTRGLLAIALVVTLLTGTASATTATSAHAETTAKAAITFDVGTGKVIDAQDDRTPVPVASTIKLFTALVAKQKIPLDDQVLITPQAANEPPLKLTMAPGSRWRAGDLLHAMLIASLNDTAMALAIRAGGGSVAGFDRVARRESLRLGLADHPRIVDPSGLDGTEGVEGGNLISARDLAIVTRAFLADPTLAQIVGLRSYHFQGGDGRPHVVYNHNAFLNIYPDAIGVKTGYTDRSGHSLVAAATRGGRTLATIVIDSPDPVAFATAHLDAAFAAGPDTPGTGDLLPSPKPVRTTRVGPTPSAPPVVAATRVPPAAEGSPVSWGLVAVMAAVLAAMATLMVGARRRSRRRPS